MKAEFAWCRLAAGGLLAQLMLPAVFAGGRDDVVVEPPEFESKLSAFVYVGQFSNTRLNQIVRFDTDFQPSWVGVVGVTREFTSLQSGLNLEGEVQFAQHWGRQHHQEVNALATARWTRFPWDEWLPTSAAFGMGLSYAFEPPPLEEIEDQPASRTLIYLLVELEAALPQRGWSGFLRIHHRSGAFGAFSPARGSNFVGLGLRKAF